MVAAQSSIQQMIAAICPNRRRTLFRMNLRVCCLAFISVLTTRAAEPVHFSRDVLPILSANCFACHGPDEKERKAKLRLDIEAEAKKPRDGEAPVLGGKPEQSSVFMRLITKDEDELMPPPESHKTLKPAQIEIMRRWIAEGAKWGRHWSFEPITRPQGTIDSLVKEKLAEKELTLRPRAAAATLMRRLSLDLTGLPPSNSSDASNLSDQDYEALVDSLLASQAFGEHWARMWLDLARYADTKGYEKDLGRTIWPWRDWVINALNADMPLDQFTLEQLAGDLLPNATEPQIIATAFHRNTMSNDEGGTDNEEFRVAAVKDRVDTTIQVWMGLTMGCAKCHSHKYDPISNEEYYRLYALFNQTQDADLPDDSPKLSKPTPEQTHAVAEATKQLNELREELAKASGKDLKDKDLEREDPTTDKPEIAKLKAEVKSARNTVKAANEQIVAIPIMRELPTAKQRITKIHNRGNFLDQTSPVTPAVLAEFGKLPEGTPPNRIGLAKWLVNRDNPLTPRVWANRVWSRLFGIGIVETEEDFGALGTPPSNPKLLDLLAAEYRDGGWSLKKLIKFIVMSDTYRQASETTPELHEADPRNVLASRGARYRLSAEVVRDSALTVSGLLSKKMSGPPVMPPQPAGLWRSTYSAKSWIDAEGEERHRRGLYTYLKRTTPYPSFITFDGGSGEVCQIRRIRTNTPLQALVTLNDPVYLEAAAALAGKMIESDKEPATQGMQIALCRPVKAEEAKPLLVLFADAMADFAKHPQNATDLIQTTRAKLPPGVSPADFAAWIVTANAILNLDEFLTRN
jgi:hypothetical protein